MSEQQMPRYRATGEAIAPAPEPLTPGRVREFQERNPHNDAREELARRHDERLKDQEASAHDKAVQYFDANYGDLMGNPHVAQQVLAERQRIINEAAEKGGAVDWGSAYPRIGEEIRRRMGLPTSDERAHREFVAEQRRIRGLAGGD